MNQPAIRARQIDSVEQMPAIVAIRDDRCWPPATGQPSKNLIQNLSRKRLLCDRRRDRTIALRVDIFCRPAGPARRKGGQQKVNPFDARIGIRVRDIFGQALQVCKCVMPDGRSPLVKIVRISIVESDAARMRISV